VYGFTASAAFLQGSAYNSAHARLLRKPVRSSPPSLAVAATRLIIGGVALAAILAGAGGAWEFARFGASTDASAARLEAEVRASFEARSRRVRTLAESVAAEARAVDAAIKSPDAPDAARPLFDRLNLLVPNAGDSNSSATVYAPNGGGYKVLAWSDGPAEDLQPDRLAGPSALFVAPGTLGLRLVFVQPIVQDGRRIGLAAAETILSAPPDAATAPGAYYLDTSFGLVEVIGPPGAGQGPRRPHAFVVANAAGAPMIEVRFSPDLLDAARRTFRHDSLAIAAIPLLVLLVLGTGPLLDARARAPRRAWFWIGSAAATALLVAGAAALVGLARVVGLPPSAQLAIIGFAVLGVVALLPLSWWRRPRERRRLGDAPVRFVVEHVVAGGFVTGVALAIVWFLSVHINAASLDQWQFPLFPFRLESTLYLAGLLLVETAAYWAMASGLAVAAERWRLTWREPARGVGAAVLWLGPLAVTLVAAERRGYVLPAIAIAAAALTTAVFALGATTLRRRYRRTTQSMRLALLLLGLLVPSVVFYPVASFYADRTAQQLVERDYGPATAGLPQHLLAELRRAEQDVDRIPALADLVKAPAQPGAAPSNYEAFEVWNSTTLAQTRVTSAIELYGPNHTLTSRFALNVPEYGAVNQTSQPSKCTWVEVGEVVPFGAEERRWLHAERGLCGENRTPQGAVIIHVLSDYRALSFVASDNPYYDVLHAAETGGRGSRIADLQVVVYGWSLAPVFTSGTIAWPLTPAIADRLTASRAPFWQTLQAEGHTYRVHFSSDRSFVYALGYPAATAFDHVTRLAAAVALTAVLFVVLLLGATIYAPLARRRAAPVRVLIDEVRTSFYRKLFLYFVLAAVGPVFALALAFGAYMGERFRADVASEAASVVTAARRLLEASLALQQRPEAAQSLTDDVMVSIGQVINQDVNVFRGSELLATSQRDLFDSGLLPTRTPAGVYRHVALDRLPSYVEEDRIGDFRYLAAAAPVAARERDEVLSVPLALRQRELDREIDALNRGVLAGAVFVIVLVAGLGVYVAGRISDPVARLSRATRQIAAGHLDVRIVADTADELRRLVDDFNTMAATLRAQQIELARSNQLKAWAEMARQVAHEIKNPLTPIQLAAEHLQRVHADQGRPLGHTFDQCVDTILRQVRLLRQIAGEFSNYAAAPTPHLGAVAPHELLRQILQPYETGLGGPGARTELELDVQANLPAVHIDRTLIARALTNLIENALQAMPDGGVLRVRARREGDGWVAISVADTGVGMDDTAQARAFEPYFSTKTAGSGLGLPNARRNVELCGGTVDLVSAAGAGTTITIRLRAAAAPDATAPGSAPAR
jgi:signal transduction histidine kinase